MAEERDDRRRAVTNVHGTGSVHHWLRAVPGHRGHDRRQRARLHRRVSGPQAPAPVQLSARVAGRLRSLRGPASHAHGPALPGPRKMAFRHFHVRPLGTCGLCYK